MNLEEAKKKYNIDIPSDEVFYSKEYNEYFSNEGVKEINPELEKYRLFDDMYKKCFIVTFGEKKEKDESYSGRNAIILGGQTGAGKSRISKIM